MCNYPTLFAFRLRGNMNIATITIAFYVINTFVQYQIFLLLDHVLRYQDLQK